MGRRWNLERDFLARRRGRVSALLVLGIFATCFATLMVDSRGHAQPAANDKRPAVPASGAVTKSQGEIREIFKAEFAAADKPGEKIALAKKLLDTGRKTTDDATARYALWVLARDLAIEAGEMETALDVGLALGELYDVDEVAERLTTLQRCIQSPATSAETQRTIAERALAAGRGLVDDERFDRALDYARFGYEAARLSKNAELLKTATEFGKNILAAGNEQTAYRTGLETLKSAPNDPPANLAVGRWLWFRKDRPDEALPHLAKTVQSPLQAAALAELAKPGDTTAQIALAERWLTLAKGIKDETINARILAHAGDWYRRALPGASGIQKIKIEQRLAELSPAKASGGKELATPVGKNPAVAAPFPDRQPKARAIKALEAGGSKETEAAIESGLRWIASAQARDGGWNFDTSGILNGTTQAGSGAQMRNGATGIALLAFLGAGYTHRNDNPFKASIQKGLTFLTANLNPKYSNATMASWHEPGGTMYSHAIATAALCEAYALSKDRSLQRFAQGGINFIVAAQDPVGGGWRLPTATTGDTSVLAWQMMALKSGAAAGFPAPAATLDKARTFLDSVSDPADGRSSYGYTTRGRGTTTTPIGLLGRINLGWKKDEPGLASGTQTLARLGPNRTNFYFNYYASLALVEWGDDDWKTWNTKLCEITLASQTVQGIDAGSWGPTGRDATSEQGGRLLCTCMTCLTLETYYRYPRIYAR